ncbi:MAG: hypothetical protein M3Y03_05755 [Verrucomicrobiota bacterium]|nr:hypothetical protein [Verrucomicrobiota bacterium]
MLQVSTPQEFPPGRHLTPKQQGEIAVDLQGATAGPISFTAASADSEAVCYEVEIANVLQKAGCEVEIHNASVAVGDEISPGLELTIKEETVRPIHASRVVSAFRRAGMALTMRINQRRQNNDTVYINVGANDAPVLVAPPTSETTLRKWKMKFFAGKF